jgi:hypothetical protein
MSDEVHPADRASPLKGLTWVAVALALGLGLGLGLPAAARHVPWSVEKKLGAALGAYPDGQACEGTDAGRARGVLDAIVRRIFPLYPGDSGLPVTIELRRGQTVNAFAVLGGRIYVFEGLLRQARSPEELAGILAHEIEHVRRRHVIQGVFVRLLTTEAFRLVFSGSGPMSPDVASLLANLRFTREQERQADEGGLARLRDAEVRTEDFARFFERLEGDSRSGLTEAILSDHPAGVDRAALARSFAPAHPRPVVSPEHWALLKAACR